MVDDNRDAADSLACASADGPRGQTAYDGLEAVQPRRAFRPDVVLLDIGLPRMNGYEAAAQHPATAVGQDMVLVALTGWGQEEDKRRALDAGFDHHMTSRWTRPRWRSCCRAWTPGRDVEGSYRPRSGKRGSEGRRGPRR